MLEDVKNYTFLTNGSVPVTGVDDAVEFKCTVQAMQIMGLNAEELSGKLLIMAHIIINFQLITINSISIK